jgi:hypothetical protein
MTTLGQSIGGPRQLTACRKGWPARCGPIPVSWDTPPVDETAVITGYDALLTSVGSRAGEIGDRPVVTHWPHVGSAYRGLVIVGQAVYGWGDDYRADHFQTEAGRQESIAAFRARVDRPDPLDWIETHSVRTSPFWRAVRRLVEALEPDLEVPWYARFAWVNLYPAAPEDPPGNPGGALREAQDPHVGPLLRAVTDWLDAKRIIAVVGPFWWSAAGPAGLADLPEEPRPLLRAGRSGGRTWVVGWHPNGASHRGFGPAAYTHIIVNAVAKVESTRA